MSQFSIVIPVYNTEKYLDCCLESVLTQSFQDFEIILVDDGSPDRAPALCDAWAEKDCRIRVVHQENGGLSSARNTGIHHASGEYLLFLDSDDWWSNAEVLNSLAKQLCKTPVDVLSFNYQKSYDENLEPPYFAQTIPASEYAESLAQMMQGGRWVTGACNKAIRRSLVAENSLFFRTGITSEDIDWTLRLALCSQTFAFTNVCVFVYRQRASSISHSGSRKKTECLCNNICECVRLLDAADPAKAELMMPFLAYQYGTLLYNVANTPRSERSKELMAEVRDMQGLLAYSDNPKVRLLRIFDRALGLSVTLFMLRLWQALLRRRGKEA